ncbi:glucoamylase family protein [Sphingobacterium sp. HJSM2_6]|uniref:glucoamylase family protein n=1 Tax=Sphingobacterium sp. HJSM2_6 TaxID=3366264 RepID=UPI003BDB10A6
MQLRLLFIFVFILCSFSSRSETYPQVIFDNSLVKGAYARSFVDYMGGSWVENVHRHLLVSDSLFFTPGNALSLKYQSNPAGDWNVLIKYSRQKFHYRVTKDDVLNLKIYVSSTNTEVNHLPKIAIQQGAHQSVGLALAAYIEEYNENTWLSVKIPVQDFAGLNMDNIISGIILQQQQSSADLHSIFIDQIEFLPAKYSNAPLTSAAILSKVTAFGKHIDLQWQVPLTPSIRYVKIYRSTDNKEFTPVAIRPTYMLGCLDYIPLLDKKYYYKIAWVDYNYRESPFSEVKEVEAKEIPEEQLVNLIQFAHINYFVENYDINSGMYMPFRIKDKATVSVKETGGAILSLLVGVEKGYVSKPMFINRMKRMVDFLLKAQNNYGFFPAYFDGRKGLPEYLDGEAKYDVMATSSIIEALLVTRQYLKGDDPVHVEIRNAITTIWERINWQQAVLGSDSTVLRSTLNMVDEFNKVKPVWGINQALNTYLLSIASPKHPLPVESYLNSITHKYEKFQEPITTDSLLIDSTQVDSLFVEETAEVLPFVTADSLIRMSSYQDTSLYGIQVPFGNLTANLLEIYRPFVTINPKLAKLGELNLYDIVQRYSQIVKRRDNEIGVGISNSDIWGFYHYPDNVGDFRINPAISTASIFVGNVQAKRSLITLYKMFGETLFSEYGFRSWMDLKSDDVSDEYVAANQAYVAVMLENSKTELIWKLYQEIPEIKSASERIFKN